MTGEHPAAPEAPKEPALSLSFDRLLVLASFVGSLCVAYGGYRVTQRDVESNTARIGSLEQGASAQKEAHAALKERVSIGETNYSNVDKKLGEMNAKLDRILEIRGTSNANYRPRPSP